MSEQTGQGMAADDQAMAAEIEAAVRAVPGVTAIFRTGGFVAKMLGAGAQLLGIQQGRTPLIQWEHAAEGVRVEAAIGVHTAAGAAQTSRRVHEAITALCEDRGYTPRDIQITVVHLDDDPARAPIR